MEAFVADPGNTPKLRICTSELVAIFLKRESHLSTFSQQFFAFVNDNAGTLNGSFEKVLTQETSIGVRLQPKLAGVHGVGL